MELAIEALHNVTKPNHPGPITHKIYWFAATIFLVGHPLSQAAKMRPLTLDLPGQQ
jgi:hypothetical protein